MKTFSMLTSSMETKTQALKGRCATLRGRLALFHMLVASKLWYVATVCIIPKSVIVQITRLMFRFIWGGSFERISRDTLYLDKKQGGLGVPNLELRCEAFQIQHMGIFCKGTGGGLGVFGQILDQTEVSFTWSFTTRKFVTCVFSDKYILLSVHTALSTF